MLRAVAIAGLFLLAFDVMATFSPTEVWREVVAPAVCDSQGDVFRIPTPRLVEIFILTGTHMRCFQRVAVAYSQGVSFLLMRAVRAFMDCWFGYQREIEEEEGNEDLLTRLLARMISRTLPVQKLAFSTLYLFLFGILLHPVLLPFAEWL